MELMTKEGMLAKGILVDTGEVCEAHSEAFYQRRLPTGSLTSPFCLSCVQDGVKQTVAGFEKEAYQNNRRFHAYGLFERESIISPELKEATFQNFDGSELIDNNALYFARKMCKHYFSGGKGNTILTGPPGVGKSHLTIAMARELNKEFDDHGYLKSILFMPVSRLFTKIQESFNGKGEFTEQRAIDLLTGVDLLFLDDLGKESVMSNQIKPANDWRQKVLFDILDARERTIINTNFTSTQIKSIYDAALADRIFKGSTGQVYVFPENSKSKRW